MAEFTINCFDLKKLNKTQMAALLGRTQGDITHLMDIVRPVLDAVRERGDSAVSEYTEKFDHVAIKPAAFRAKPAEFDAALKAIGKPLRAAIERAAANVLEFHRRQMPNSFWMEKMEPGVFAGEKITPIDSAGLYIPRGKGAFPSVMIMLASPAVVAGVPRIAAFTPPTPDGHADAATLAAAKICGITEVYSVGGSQAVAAMAYGTKSIPRVDKITGPGSGYVTAAKRLLYGVVDVGLPAGPSESIVLADSTTDPELAVIDLLVEAEHGPDSAALLVTDSDTLAKKALKLLPDFIARLPEPRRTFVRTGLGRYGGIVIARSRAESIEFTNQFAPEHLIILTSEPFEALDGIRNAGEILVGPHTPITMGNYCVGINAILPTGGFARTYSGVSVFDFLKRSSVAWLTKDGFDALAPTARTLARYEGFPAHAMAVEHRMANGAKQKKR